VLRRIRGRRCRLRLERDLTDDFFRGYRCRRRLERDRTADVLEIGPSQPLLPIFLQLGLGLFEGWGDACKSHYAGLCPHAVNGPKPLGIRFVWSVPLVNAPDLQLAIHHEVVGVPTLGSAGGIRMKRERHAEDLERGSMPDSLD
jgi:hypothetical protein